MGDGKLKCQSVRSEVWADKIHLVSCDRPAKYYQIRFGKKSFYCGLHGDKKERVALKETTKCPKE